jgi:hypothetical protein
MITREKLIALIEEAGLSDHAEQLLTRAQPAIHLKLQRVENEGEIEIGQSKSGGSPDLPTGIEWPYWQDKPLIFMMQIRLSQVAPFDSQNLLPYRGMLYFFYAADSQPWGFDPASRGSNCVLFINHESVSLSRAMHPTAPGEYFEIGSLPACNITFSSTLTLPPVGQPEFVELGLEHDSLERYWTLHSSITRLSRPMHRLLGYPEQIQGDMQVECQLVSHGINCHAGEFLDTTRR